MPLGIRSDPVLGYNFLVTLIDSSPTPGTLGGLRSVVGALTQGAFSECSGLEITMQAEEHKEGGRNGGSLKFPNRVAWANIRLRRGITISNDLWDWHYSYVEGRGKRRDGIIVLQNDLHEPVRVWRFARGLPVKWSGPSLNAGQSQVAIEELEIAHEGLQMGAQAALALGEVSGLLGS